MKPNSLKFIRNGIAIIATCSLMIACNNEGNNSTTTGNENKSSDSAGNPASPDSGTVTINKRKGRVSVNMMAGNNNSEKMKKDEMGYYNFTEVLPAYNGGQDALVSYINNNIEYPQTAIDNNVEGTVNVEFIVDEKGNVADVKTVGNKIGYGLEEEAVRVVSRMPQWTPGEVKGKYVKTKRTLPIIYRLES